MSIGRFHCVSKLWWSMLHRPYFTELFLTRSSTRPRLLFAIQGGDSAWSFFSLRQPQNQYKNSSSLVVAADFHMRFPSIRKLSCGYASGLICFHHIPISKEVEDTVHVICNPNTGQYSILPKLIEHRYLRPFLGFDPTDKQYKVLSIDDSSCDNRILTLEIGKMRWKKVHCPLNHRPWCEGICINGVLYYLASDEKHDCVIVCFDVKFIDAKCFCGSYRELINCKGKIGLISWKYVGDGITLELRICVREDVEKQEWSENVHTLPDYKFQGNGFI